MTVEQLIARLREFDPGASVEIGRLSPAWPARAPAENVWVAPTLINGSVIAITDGDSRPEVTR
jgi:hypothetical protein